MRVSPDGITIVSNSSHETIANGEAVSGATVAEAAVDDG